jgi:hypothetical protein
VINVSESVRDVLESTEIDERDEATAALCRRYADLMDAPGVPLRYRTHLTTLAILADAQGNALHVAAIEAISAALSEQSVTSDLGPKLLAGLSALGLTPMARGEKAKEPERVTDPGRRAHDEIGALRAERKNRAKA